MSSNIQKRYISGVGSLPYLVNHSRPKLSNAVRKLSKCKNESNTSHCKALICAIKYVIDTKDYLCQMKPKVNLNGPWQLIGYSDTDYAGDNYTRESVTGYIIIVNGFVIAWCLRSYKIVTIYYIESEYLSIIEVCE